MVVEHAAQGACGVFKADFDARRVAVGQDAACFVVVDRVAHSVVPAPARLLPGDEVLGSEGVDGAARAASGALVQARCPVNGQYAAQGVGDESQVGPRRVQVPTARYPAAVDPDVAAQYLDFDVLTALGVFLVGQADALRNRLGGSRGEERGCEHKGQHQGAREEARSHGKQRLRTRKPTNTMNSVAACACWASVEGWLRHQAKNGVERRKLDRAVQPIRNK